jgi:predicted component of type VI protein secretion system
MRALTIGDLLTEFEPRLKAARTADERVIPFERRTVRPAPSAPSPPPDPAAKLQEAYERGKKEGREAALAECENKLRDYGLESARRRTEERERWTAEQAAVLATQFQDAWATFESRLTGTISRLLEPVLADTIRREALQQFVAHLDAIIKNGDQPVLRIGGPADLLDAIRSKIGNGMVSLQYVPQAGSELRLMGSQLVLETQIQAWIDRIKQAAL